VYNYFEMRIAFIKIYMYALYSKSESGTHFPPLSILLQAQHPHEYRIMGVGFFELPT
jgi:hypothetical protein